MENKRLELIKNNIIRLFDDVMTMEGQYSMPYSTADDDYADWSVIFKIDKVALWETEKYQRCKYSGTIYLEPIEITKSLCCKIMFADLIPYQLGRPQ